MYITLYLCVRTVCAYLKIRCHKCIKKTNFFSSIYISFGFSSIMENTIVSVKLFKSPLDCTIEKKINKIVALHKTLRNINGNNAK